MKIGIIGLGRMGFVQARLGRYFGDEILWGCDKCFQACEEFHREFHVPVSSDIANIDFGQCDVVWITVNDDEIENCASVISGKLVKGTTVFHTSGVMDSTILKSHLPLQCCASYHPLQACPVKNCTDKACVDAYLGVIHSVEGDTDAISIAKSLIERLGARFVQINASDKVLYHAAAVFASNYPLILMDIAVQLFEKCGFDEDSAISACRLMLTQVVKSLGSSSIQDALTGPIKRKDLCTIRRHESALEKYPEYLRLYDMLKEADEKMLQR